MTYSYKIKTFVLDLDGNPDVPGSRKISRQRDGFFVAYGPFDNKRRSRAMAVIYRDPSGSFLVGAEQSVLNTIPGDDDIDKYVKKDPSKWHTWKCDLITPAGKKIKDRIFTTSKMSLVVLATNPVVDNGFSIVGAIPVVPGSLGDFSALDVEKDAKWIGDKLDKSDKETI